jgi:hypothetical protein
VGIRRTGERSVQLRKVGFLKKPVRRH